MPIPILPVLSTLLGVGSQIFGASQQNRQNEASQKFAMQMYGRQRQDALTDWNMQNAYNAPDQQMKRLIAAGLNPNLVYGNGAVATSQQQPRQSSAPNAQFNPSRLDLQQPLMGAYDMEMKSTQMDMLRENMQLIKLKQISELYAAENKSADTAKKNQDIARSKYDLGFQVENREALSATIRQHLEKLKADTTFTLDSNERAAALNAQSVRKAAEEILSIRLGRAKTQAEIDHIRQQIENLRTSKELQDLEAQWMREGKTKGDWYFWRFLNDAVGGGAQKAIKGSVDKIAPLNRYTPKMPWEFWK